MTCLRGRGLPLDNIHCSHGGDPSAILVQIQCDRHETLSDANDDMKLEGVTLWTLLLSTRTDMAITAAGARIG